MTTSWWQVHAQDERQRIVSDELWQRVKTRPHAGVTVEADGREIRLYSEQGYIAGALLRAIGTHAARTVAGVDSVLTCDDSTLDPR